MLRIYDNLDNMDFRQLMDVYGEWNELNGAEQYPNLPLNLQLLYAEQDFYYFLKEFFAGNGAIYCLWEHQNHYKAALRLEDYSDGLLLEALETAPEERRCGYAKHLLLATIEYVAGKGKYKIYSHISKNNRASLTLHQSCGFVIISDNAVFIDDTFHSDYYTLLYKC